MNKTQDNRDSDSKRKDKRKEEEREQEHLHYLLTCGRCSQQFEICGLPCFVFCPRCRICNVINFTG